CNAATAIAMPRQLSQHGTCGRVQEQHHFIKCYGENLAVRRMGDRGTATIYLDGLFPDFLPGEIQKEHFMLAVKNRNRFAVWRERKARYGMCLKVIEDLAVGWITKEGHPPVTSAGEALAIRRESGGTHRVSFISQDGNSLTEFEVPEPKRAVAST